LGKAWVQGGTYNNMNQNKATRKYNNNNKIRIQAMNKIIKENKKMKTNRKPCQVHWHCA
jgi:hypothetical protein